MTDVIRVLAKKRGEKGEHRLIDAEYGKEFKIGPLGDVDVEAMRSGAIRFSAEAALDDDECYFVDLDEGHSGMMEAYIQNAESTAGVSVLGKDDYSSMEVIYVARIVDGEAKGIAFQKITSGVRVDNGICLLFYDGGPKIKERDRGIRIVDRVDAFYDVEHRRIYFREFPKIKCMFDGIEDYYRIATEAEVRKIKECGYLNIGENVKISERNLKRIATIVDERILDRQEYKVKLNEIFNEYGEMLGLEKGDDGKIQIRSGAELSKALSVMMGRCFTNEITGEKTVAVRAEKITPVPPENVERG